MLLVFGLLLGLPGVAHAQTDGGERPTAPRLQGPESVTQYLQGQADRLPPALRDRLPARTKAQLRALRRHRAERTSPGASSPGPQDIGGLPELGPSQSWVLNENPDPQFNFDVTGTPQYAGDVNGDDTNDYLYATPLRDPARDERTPDVLEDETGKTAVFFGDSPGETEDQFFHTQLVPVGDLTGDGLDDAVGVNQAEGTVGLYVGLPFVGYQDTGVNVSPPVIPPQLVVRGFSDIDGDGFEDVVLGSAVQDAFLVAYGASTPEGSAVEVYNPGSTRTSFQYNVADLGGATGTEVVRLAGRTFQDMDLQLQVFEIGSDRTLTEAQNVPVEELGGNAQDHELSLVDIDGSGQPELATTQGFDAPTHVFPQETTDGVSFVDGPVLYEADDARPVGDLDGDGRHDFYVFDEDTNTRYIAFGPSTLEEGLSFDTEIPYDENVVGAPEFVPQGGLGDVTGDGRPDVVLDLTDQAGETVGRRFFSVNSDGTGRTPVDVSFPRGHFFDPIVATKRVGDLNDDGTDDLAVVRSSLGQVEIFYGGSSISGEPDLTLETPVTGGRYLNVAGGDFDGDGADDLAAGYNTGAQIDVYLGGAEIDAQVDHVIDPADFDFGGTYVPQNIGDVNGDGTDDLLATDLGFFGEQQNLAVFFGGSPLPDAPDATPQYTGGSFAGITAAAPGDLNGDGTEDFVVGRPNFVGSANARGRADVYFGDSAPSFSSPDRTLRPENDDTSIFQYAFGLAGGDFDGDGQGDVAVRPAFAAPTATPSNATISVYEGDGSGFDDQVDRRLSVPAETGVGTDLDGDGFSNQVTGRLETAPAPGTDADGLIQSSSAPTNALLYRPSAGTAPAAVFRAPNQDADMGNAYFNSVAAGDLTGNDRADVVFAQSDDNNDAARSSRVYRYDVPENLAPVATDDSFSTPEGQTLTVEAPGVLENDTDGDGDALTASLVSDVSSGSLTLDGDGSFEYTPDAGFTGTDQFAYEASDGTVADTATATIEVGSGGGVIPIAEARAQGVGTTVTVEGTVSRAFGDFVRFQDESGPTGASALVVRQTEGPFHDDVADGTIQSGTTLRVTGTLSAFAGLLQVNEDDLTDYSVLDQGAPPAPQAVTLSDVLAPDGEEYESELLRVEGLSFPEASGTFSESTTYTVEGPDGTSFPFRVQTSDETAIIGEPIPDGSFTYQGVLGQFDFNGNDEGYQLIPVRPADVQGGPGECPLAWSLDVGGTDAADDSLSVTFGQAPAATAGIDPACGEQEQPPEPPSDVFDLRFTGTDLPGVGLGEGLVRDLRPTDQPTPEAAESAPATWRLEVQSSSYPVTLTWDHTALADSLPAVPVRLVDVVTGGDLVDVDMKSTGSYTLDNSSITALEIRLDRALTREVPIAEGWNLLSVPLEAPDPSFGATLSPCESGFFFEPGAGYQPIADGDTVSVGRGLFANCSGGTAQVTGQAPAPTIEVAQGWNIVGALADSVDVGTITSDPPGIVLTDFFGFDQTNGYQNASTLAPGGGYWVKVSESGALDLSGSEGGAALSSAQVAATSQEPSGTPLRITDAAGRTATLRLAQDVSERQRQRNALPPTPPSGVFDVRFGSGRSVADVGNDDGLRQIETQGLEVPVTIKLTGAEEGQSVRLRHGGETTRLTAERSSATLSSTEDLAVGLQATPEAFALKKTYPNPASGRATVEYALPERADVTLAVYDVLGRRVATLADGATEAGRHTAVLDAGQMPSGTYFVRMRAADFQQTRRVTVVR